MTFQNPQEAAAHIEQTIKKDSPLHAVQELEHTMQDYGTSHGPQDTQQFFAQLSKKLEDDKVLPVLSIAWAQEHLSDYSHDGTQLSRKDLTLVPAFESASLVDKRFSEAVLDQFDTLKNAHTGWFGFDAPGINNDDLKTRMGQIETERKAQNDKETHDARMRDFASPLVKDGNALFNKIASQHVDQDKQMDYFTYDDLKSLRDADVGARKATLDKQPILTIDERKCVDTMLKDYFSSKETLELNRGDSHPGQDCHYSIAMKDLVAASGFKNVQEMNDTLGKKQEVATSTDEKKTHFATDDHKQPAAVERRPVADHQHDQVHPESSSDSKHQNLKTEHFSDHRTRHATNEHGSHNLKRPTEAANDQDLPANILRFGEGYIAVARRISTEGTSNHDLWIKAQELMKLNNHKPLLYRHTIVLP